MVPEPGRFWFTLDNAAKIYPAITTKEVTSVFRLTAVLKQPVNIRALQKAVLYTEKTYPYFLVRLRKGFFWYYLEEFPQHIPIETDKGILCKKFSWDGLLIRILVRDHHISTEFSHILADGSGAMEFFKTLLISYSGSYDSAIPSNYEINKLPGPVSAEEYEDAYKRYFQAEIPPILKRTKAYHLPYSLKSSPRFTRLNTIVRLDQIKHIAREKGVSVTVYLVAVYLHTLQQIAESDNKHCIFKKNRILRVQVPVNLRNIFPSKTKRNFSLFVMPEIDLRLGHYSFDEIIQSVHHQTKLEIDAKLINKNISRNVGGEKKFYVRGIPLFLKSLILRMKYYSLGSSQYSGVLTNLGKIELPDETRKRVDYLIMTPPPPNKMLKMNCGVVGFDNKLLLSFGSITQSKVFENRFLRFLRTHHIEINIEKTK